MADKEIQEESSDNAPKQSGGKKSRLGLAALIGAVIVAAGAIGYRTLSDQGPSEEIAATDAAPPTIESLKTAAEDDPLNAGAWQELGFAYYETEQFDLAAKAYRQAIEGDKDNAVLWSSLGEARLMGSQDVEMPSAAISAFEKAIELD
jgi:cytochrome c-type biogenesis protein CcmH